MTVKHYHDALNCYNLIILFKIVYEVIMVLLARILRVCSLRHSCFLTPPPDTRALSLVDLVGLAWKHRMKHAKLGSKEAHRLSRGRSRHKHVQTVESQGGLSALWVL